MRALLITVCIVVFALPQISSAMSNTQLLAQITGLLEYVQKLQAQLDALQGGSVVPGPVVGTVATPTPIGAGTAHCVQLTTVLERGDRGDDVAALQRYLTQTGHYTYGEVTAYYGSATEEAVQRFQAARDIVYEGTPATTGYGVVGPSTRRALTDGCVGVEYNDAVAEDLVITPREGIAPVQVEATFAISGSSCSSYIVDWGDNSEPLLFDAGDISACTRDIAHTRATHTYKNPGQYTVRFRAVRGPLTDARLVSTHTVTLGGVVAVPVSRNTNNGSLCTTEHAPVCGRLTDVCAAGYICDESGLRTYSNRCELEEADAEFVKEGEC